MKQLQKILLGMVIFTAAAYSFEAIGIVLPKHHLHLTFAIDGKVSHLLVREGDRVLKDKTILQLEDKLQKYDAKRKELIHTDTAFVDSLSHNEKLLKEMVNSTRELYENTKSISKDELISLEIRYYETLGQLIATKQKKLIEGIEYEMSNTVLKSHSLKAPISGVITKINYDVGEWVRSGETVVELVAYEECYVEFNIEKNNISHLKVGDTLPLKVKSGDDKEIEKMSKVVFISAVADKSSGLVRIKTQFSNKDLSITPGLSAVVTLENKSGQKLDALKDGLIPLDSVKK
ncbi:MAG: efflux RND transporter periplasmic adaptor subunit [Sulfurimonas sp.]|nr:efflux RND transporter periplasmic adaptor subunit [Sulfurimonas sp.]MBU1216055.1 efflux RND transporter periplasmic adaptor subunit [bacterium]MBU1434361.1 efflux RND transporter periplasmic adaptor subunit [bacterium]MBU1501939.1 efflux RND transporter periplasmic adaptor subunit [bacterium]MBU3939570.1 efflux RND transporter periplasmic adaptor subunit [bacterium]